MVARPDYIPEDYNRIAVVDTEEALFSTELREPVNCVFMQRKLSGDFNALASVLGASCPEEYIYQLGPQFERRVTGILHHVSMDEGYPGLAMAAEQVMDDMAMLKRHRILPELRVINPGYYGIDEHTLHMDDGADYIRDGTFMCCYNTPTTGWARNDECDRGGYTAMCSRVFSQVSGQRRHFEPGDMIRQCPNLNAFRTAGFIHAAEYFKSGTRLLLIGRGPY